MHFNGEVTLGNLLIMVSLAVTVMGAYYSLKGRMDVFSTMFESMKDTFETHNRRVDRLEMQNEARLMRLENNDIRITDIVQELIGQNNERARWDGRMDRREHKDGR